MQNWTVNESPGASATEQTTQLGSLINGTFTPSSTEKTITISKEMLVNVTEFPTINLVFNSSSSVPIGVNLFEIESNGSHVPVGNLNQLVGNGTYQDIRTNIVSGNAKVPASDNLLVEFYLNEGPGTAHIHFFLQVKSLQFLGYPISQMTGSGIYHSTYLSFDSAHAVWELVVANVIMSLWARQSTRRWEQHMRYFSSTARGSTMRASTSLARPLRNTNTH